MVPDRRRAFNAAWTEEQYAAMVAGLERRTGESLTFPLSETPCFFPATLLDRLSAIGKELIAASLAPAAATAAAAMVPARFRGPHQETHPTFVQVDFGLTQGDDGAIEPKLVELQAFASLYAFQFALADAYRDAFNIGDVSTVIGDMEREAYPSLLRGAIVGDHDPEQVVLMEIDPQHQKTLPDFRLTETLWGVRTVDVRAVRRHGRELRYQHNGRAMPIRRVYNRVIPDEIDRSGVELPFDYRDDLDVEWAGHPEWFFRISKFSIPFLGHSSVPRTWFLSDVSELPDARERLLLKPLFSFAGSGIIFAPTSEQLAAIPADQRNQYILQERVGFAPVIDTPHGPTQAEIRMMYVWTDRLRAVLPLVRMGRGRMMGVAHNKGLRWVGASTGFGVEGPA
jgi:hypothetical protein